MGARLFVENLNPRTTESQLARFFSSIGVLASVSIPVDPSTGRSRGVAVVEFDGEEHAEAALVVFDGRELGGRVLSLRWANDDEAPLPPGRRSGGRPRHASRGKPPPSADDELDEPGDDRDDFADYAKRRRLRRRRGGRHGSDRTRVGNARRVLTD